jgi:hypothetical protein
MREKLRTVPLTVQIPAEKYRALQEMSRLAGKENSTFFREPSLLECWFCPCGNKEKNSCPGAGDGSCAETFFRFIFAEGDDHVSNNG